MVIGDITSWIRARLPVVSYERAAARRAAVRREVVRRLPVTPSPVRAAERRAAVVRRVKRVVRPAVRKVRERVVRPAAEKVREARERPLTKMPVYDPAAAREMITAAAAKLGVDFKLAAERRQALLTKGISGVPKQALAGIAEMGVAYRAKQESRVEAMTARQQAKFQEDTISEQTKWFQEQTARVATVARGFEEPIERKMLELEKRVGLHAEWIPAPVKTVGWAAKELGYGVAFTGPAGVVELAGMAPMAVEAMARRRDIILPAIAVGAVTMGREMWKGATTSPTRLAGEFATFGAVLKGVGEAPKISPAYLGRLRGVDPFTGRPSFVKKLMGEKPHPTPKAEMAKMYDPAIYEAVQSFFHGTSLGFVKQIRAKGKLEVTPEKAALRGPEGVEASLFLSEPGRPYVRFATPETIVKIGKGAAAKEIRASMIEQLMTGKLTKQQIADMGLKEVKASRELRSRISKRESLQRKLAELEKSKLSDISPKRMKTEADLYDLMQKIEKQTVKEYGKATGERISVHDEPGAFLMVEAKPRRFSPELIDKAMRRESLRELEKSGKISTKQRSELRQLERELKREVSREYFDIPPGEIVPGPKPTWGYEWKGIPEAEFTMRAGTLLYPEVSGRSIFYERFGITKGTHFTQDPYTGRWMEIQKVTTTKPAPPHKPTTLIDIPELLHPFKKITDVIKKRRLTQKEKSEITKIDREIEKAVAKSDLSRIEELSGRRRVILYGERGRAFYPIRPTRRITRVPDRIIRETRLAERDIRELRDDRVPRDIRRVERDIRELRDDRVPRDIRRVERDIRELRDDRVPRDIRRVERDIRERSDRIIRETKTTEYERPPPPPPTTIFDPEDEKKRALRKRRKAEKKWWLIENPIAELDEIMIGRRMEGLPEKKSRK